MRPDDLASARRSPLLATLDGDALRRVLIGTLVCDLPKGAKLLGQGDQAEALYVILDGRVALAAERADGVETVVELFGPGDAVILPAVMLAAPALMTVRISHDARLLVLPAEPFRARLAAEPDLALAAARLLAGYWRRLVRQIKDLKLRSGPQRLAGYLLGLAAGAPGPIVVELPGDRKLVAARLGITPESLSRAFLALRAVGVGGAGRRIRLEDPGRLRAFSQDDGLV